MHSSEIVISRQALLHNLRQFRTLAPKSQIMCVVKSNAYGHGSYQVASVVEEMTDWLAVVNLDEALWLRGMGISKPILVLSYYDSSQIAEAIKKNISLVVYDRTQAEELNRTARKLKKLVRVHVKIDTGTSRLGIMPDQAAEFVEYLNSLKNLEIEGIMSHFAASEEDSEFTKQQLDKFKQIVSRLNLPQARKPILHIACSAASLLQKDSRLDAVRLGIGLYGLWPSLEAKSQMLKLDPKFELRPALSWKTKIIQLKQLPAGSFIGYGKSYQTQRDTLLAVLPVGYFEGYDRGLSNKAEVLIAGQRCKILGRICMNLTMVDVTDAQKVKVGDEAVLIGKQDKEEITADELAEKIGTINYEVVTRINPMIPRILK
jgi:alanine racemase